MKNFRQIDFEIDEEAIRKEITYILSHRFIPRNWLQISIQTPNKNAKPETDWDVTIGRLKHTGHTEPEVRYFLWDTPIINGLIERFGFFRCRLMRMAPKSCLTWHHDGGDRFHLPLVTNPGCRMVIENECFHLPAFKLFWTKTSSMHTAYNLSSDWRTHLMGCVTPAVSALYDSSLP